MNKRQAFVKDILIGFRTENTAFWKWGMGKNRAEVALRVSANMFYLQKINSAKR